MLYQVFYEPCVRLAHTSEPDGEGGWRSRWEDGDQFMAAVVLDTSADGPVADSERLSRAYRVTAPTGTGLRFHEAFRRLSDGQAFLVTSAPEDMRTPEVASFGFEIVTADAWEVPDEQA